MKPITKINSNQDVHNLIYTYGNNFLAVIRFYEDGGHGWLQVPKFMCDALNITEQISSYSYQNKKYYFLEEDLDLSLFFVAAGIDNFRDFFWTVCPREIHEDSTIRKMQRVEVTKRVSKPIFNQISLF